MQSTRGATILELLIVLTMVGLLSVTGVSGFRSYRDAASLDRAARAVRVHLAYARSLAVARRETLRVRLSPESDLWLLDSHGLVLATVPTGLRGPFPTDSIKVRPSTLRFNSRGQAAPGSIYLYRRHRAVRLVSNFLGRVREVRFSTSGS